MLRKVKYTKRGNLVLAHTVEEKMKALHLWIERQAESAGLQKVPHTARIRVFSPDHISIVLGIKPEQGVFKIVWTKELGLQKLENFNKETKAVSRIYTDPEIRFLNSVMNYLRGLAA